MFDIFISYRRIDAYAVNRLNNYLKTEFNSSKIFIDTQGIDGGDLWSDKIENAIRNSKSILIIIGPNWLKSRDEKSGRRKIDIKNDWVRKEILIAIERKAIGDDVLIVPILVNNAEIPLKEYLDNELQPLLDLQFIDLKYTGQVTDFIQIRNLFITSKRFEHSPLPMVTPKLLDNPDELTDTELSQFLSEFSHWKIIHTDKPGFLGEYIKELYRIFEFVSYEDAYKFMNILHERGIMPYNHHPRIQNTYHRVEIWLCTFNIGHKPSDRDIRLAKIAESCFKEFFV